MNSLDPIPRMTQTRLAFLERILTRFGLAALILGSLLPALRGQTAPAQGVDQATVAALVKQMQQMESEIRDLKGQLNAVQQKAAAAPAAAPVPAQAAAPVEAGSSGGDSASSEPTYPNINFHGFGDFQYQYSSNQAANPNLFWVGEIDFYVTSQISENASILSENVLGADSTFDNWTLEAERFEFNYKESPYLNISAGRFHTELGYYNTAFHHGTWFQLDTHRPWFLEFEDSGGILPVHMVGVSLDGAIPSGSANLHYYAQVGNGRSYDPSISPANPTQADHVDNGRKAVNVAVTAKPTWAPGWQFGAGFYHQVISPQTVVAGQGPEGFDVVPSPTLMPSEGETISNASAVYLSNGWTFLNEAFVIGHQPTHDTTHHTFAGYSELGKRFGQWTPFVRYTYVNSPASDPAYNLIGTTGLRYGPTLGLRDDFTDYACLKLQYEHNSQRNEQELAPSDDVILQVGFTF
jgi:hypothetical protein